MPSFELVLAAVNAAAFLLCGAFIAYVILLIVPYLRHRPAPEGEGSAFDWHIIIPCLDEELVLEATVRRLLVKFPNIQIWCVDDGSVDDTPWLLARMASDRRVHVVTRHWPDARKGKGPALNAGYDAIMRWLPAGTDLSQVIVGVVDADADLDKRFQDIIAGPTFFGDPAVGAVQVRVRVGDRGEPGANGLVTRSSRFLVRLQDIEFGGVIAAMQMLRRHVGSVGMGGNGQFTRLASLQKVADEYGTPWHDALLEDFELGLHVLLTGSRTEYCHDTWVAQEGLDTLKALVRQRSRWAQGSMQCFRYLWPILRSQEISTAGAIEITYFLLMPWIELIGSVVYTVAIGVLVFYAVDTPGGPSAWLNNGAWGIVPLFVVFGIAPLLIWGPVYRRVAEPTMTRRTAFLIGLANWPYSYVHHVATWWAFTRVARSRHDWKKTDRTSQPTPAVLAAPAAPAPAPALSAAVPRPVPARARSRRPAPAAVLAAEPVFAAEAEQLPWGCRAGRVDDPTPALGAESVLFPEGLPADGSLRPGTGPALPDSGRRGRSPQVPRSTRSDPANPVGEPTRQHVSPHQHARHHTRSPHEDVPAA